MRLAPLALVALLVGTAVLAPLASALVPWPTCIPGSKWKARVEGEPGAGIEALCVVGVVPVVMGSCVIASGAESCEASGTYEGPAGHAHCRARGDGATAWSCSSWWQVGLPTG